MGDISGCAAIFLAGSRLPGADYLQPKHIEDDT